MDACGFSCWHPSWLQKFANIRSYMTVWGLLGTVQGISYLYIVITLTTIEKRFKIPSQTTGIILSGNEISQILLSLILAYVGGQRNRPRWLAWGVVFSALSCLILALPHFIYGAGDEAIQLTKEYSSDHTNITSMLLSKPNKIDNQLCKSTPPPAENNENEEIFSYVPLALIFMSQFVLGIGNALNQSLGQSYLDDNTKQGNTPLMLAYATAMKMLGPVFGFGFGYVMMRIYIDPSLTPIIDKEDPRWLGAWWLGWILLGTVMFIFAALIGLFPKHLPKAEHVTENRGENDEEENCDGKLVQRIEQKVETKEEEEEMKPAELKDFPKALKRLLTNKLLMCSTISTVFHNFGFSGFITFMGRLMEVQFSTSSAGGSVFTGPLSIVGMIIGLLVSGFVIKKYRPRARYVFLWSICITLVSKCASITYTQLGCDSTSNLLLANGSLVSCKTDCNCDGFKFNPVCDRDTTTTYYSPCHAGCKTFDDRQNVYSNCSCSEPSTPKEVVIENSANVSAYGRETLYPGTCVSDCTTAYYTYSVISMISTMIKSTGMIGHSLLILRAVEPRDKSIAQGFGLFSVSLFSMIPGPIIYGRIIDSTCLIWNYKNGRQGNCQLYDPVKFRYYLHSTTALVGFFGIIFDILVWYYSEGLDLYGDKKDKPLTQSEEDDSLESKPLAK